MTYASELTAELLDTDGTTVISSALNLAFDPKFMDELDGCGTSSIAIGFYDADVDNLIDGRFVRIYSNGVEAFTMQIEGAPQYKQLDKGEEPDEIIIAKGRGWGSLFDDGIIAPEPLLVGVDLDTGYRHWTFASIFFPNSTGWGPADEHYEYRDGVSVGLRVDSQVDPGADPDDPGDDIVKLYPAPIGYPWPNAEKNGNGFAPTPTYDPTYWVTADGAPSVDSVGFHFFRGTFGLGGAQQLTFFATGDNYFRMFLDGVPILEEQDDSFIWKEWKDVTLVLPAGDHTIGFVVENIQWDAANPGGALFNIIAISVYPGDTQTTLTLSVMSSSAAALPESYFSADTWPGWSPAQIIADHFLEVQARGAMVPFIGQTATDDTHDTNGDEFESADPDFVGPFIPTVSMKIGDTGLDLLNTLVQKGWLHWHMKPDTCELNVYSATSAVGVDSGAVFSFANENIRALERGQAKKYANALLVQWANGYVWVEDTAEITAHGSRVEELYVSDAANRADAITDGVAELKRRPQEAAEAILIEIEPRNSGEAPYEGFIVGDYITIPDIHDDPILQQVLSISPDSDDDGNAFWRLEVNARWPSPERAAEDLLRIIGGKTYGETSGFGVVRI